MSVVTVLAKAPTARASRDAHEELTVYFAENRAMLLSFARKIAGGVIDPQDLVADAVASAVAQIARGQRIAAVGAYLFTTMRNRVHDERRSPRSRVIALVENDVCADDEAFRSADLFRERALIRRALHSLPHEQQRALMLVVVNEERPRDLVAEFARPASSISSLVYRAKLGLRRAVLRQLLGEGERSPECRAFADALPDIFPLDRGHARTAPGFEHLGGCEACSAAWDRFTALPAS